jgi:WD40 repeat protein
MKNLKKVFISYSRRNLNVVERLARDLQDAGLEVWVDFRKIKGGEAWRQAIYNGIDESEFVIACLSASAAESEWVRRELEIAQQQKKLIIPVMLERAFEVIEQYPETKVLLDVQIINFADLNYERAFPTLLSSLPGREATANYDDIDPSLIPNPFKGLESFQETDNDFFFGRGELVDKAVVRLSAIVNDNEDARFMAFVGASGSGKSSLVRAGLIPAIRAGRLPGSDDYPIVIFKPGNKPVEAMAGRILPLIGDVSLEMVVERLNENHRALHDIAGEIMKAAPPEDRFTIIIDQFEEVFTRVEGDEQMLFLDLLHAAVTAKNGRVLVLITMRADFFDRLSHFPKLAGLFGHNNIMIVADMTSEELRNTIEGPAITVGLVYDHGLPDRILAEVQQQAGSLPLLQYSLSQLFEQRDRRRLTWDAYNAIGGVRQALARHAEKVYRSLNSAEQDLMQRLLLRLVEVSETGEATRRRVRRDELSFERVSENSLNDLLDKMTSSNVRLLVSSRELRADEDPDETKPTVYVEVVHEALIREWQRFQNWVRDDEENLRLSTEILKTAQEWTTANKDDSYLLTQSRLDRALVWVQTADASQLQRDFINVSSEARRKQEASERQQQAYVATLEEASRSRLRLLVVVLLIGVVISVAFLIRSIFSEQEAIAARQIADEQARLVRSRALSQSVLDVLAIPNSPLALALAVEANSFENPPAIAQSALAQAAYLGPRDVYEGSLIAINMRVLDLAYLENGAFALGASGQFLMLWNTVTSEVLWREGWPSTDALQTGVISPDGSLVAAVDALGNINVWELSSDTLQASFANMGGPAWDLAFRPESNELAIASNDGRIYLWDIATGTVLQTFQGHGGRVLALDFSSDGSRLASGSVDNSVRIWDVETGQALSAYTGHRAWIRSVAFNADSSRVVAGASDGTVLVWDTQTGTWLAELENAHQGSVLHLDYNPNGESFVSASSDGEIIVWDNRLLTERHRYSDYSGSVSQVIYSPDGVNLLSVGDNARIIEWDVQPGAVLRRFETHTDWVQDVALSPDGLWALSGGQDGRLVLWEIGTGTVNREILHGGIAINSVAYSPNGETAIIGLTNGELLLWDTLSWQALGVLTGHTEIIRDIVYSPDGHTVASAGDDGQLILWDVASQQIIRQLQNEQQIWSFDFTPDGLHIMFGDEAGAIGWWNTRTGELSPLNQSQEAAHHSDSVRAVAISPDGRFALTAADDLTLIRWDLRRGQPSVLNALEDVPDARIVAISFSPDARFALTASDDRNITMWEIETGEIIRRLEGHVNWVTAVEYSPDGRLAISASADNSLILWRIDSQAELLSWTINNREIAVLDCRTRLVYALEQQCDSVGELPALTPYPIGTLAATSTAVAPATLSSQGTATAAFTSSPEPAPSETALPSVTPSEFTAVLGDNLGSLEEGATDIWLFEAQAGDRLTIRLNAANPVSITGMNRRNEAGLDTVLILQDNQGKLIAENDDIVPRQHTNSELRSIELANAGIYRIIVQSFGGASSGDYTLTIEREAP